MLARIWSRSDALAIVLGYVILPFSALYWLGWHCYLALYALGFKRSSKPHHPILIVGNFTVGGSGKTPIAIYIAKLLTKSGLQPVIGCSGYGSPRSVGASLAPEGDLDPKEWGDEPTEIREELPEVPLIVGRDRVRAAEICHERYPDAALLMDDGLQHLPLKADVRIAVDLPCANRFVLPAGPYREPAKGDRADLVIPNHFRAVRRVSVWSADGEALAPESIRGHRVQVLCAIGRPDSFLDSIEDLGMVAAKVVALGDHDPMSAGTLFAPFEPELPIVVTRKDWVKIRRRSDLSQWKLWIAKLEAHIEPEEEFCAWLLPRLMSKVEKEPHL